MTAEGEKREETVELIKSAIQDFVLANNGGKLSRYRSLDDVPAGLSTITLKTVEQLSTKDIGEIYGKVVGMRPKTFKTKEIAIESLSYQICKMPIFGLVSSTMNVLAPQGRVQQQEGVPTVP